MWKSSLYSVPGIRESPRTSVRRAARILAVIQAGLRPSGCGRLWRARYDKDERNANAARKLITSWKACWGYFFQTPNTPVLSRCRFSLLNFEDRQLDWWLGIGGIREIVENSPANPYANPNPNSKLSILQSTLTPTPNPRSPTPTLIDARTVLE